PRVGRRRGRHHLLRPPPATHLLVALRRPPRPLALPRRRHRRRLRHLVRLGAVGPHPRGPRVYHRQQRRPRRLRPLLARPPARAHRPRRHLPPRRHHRPHPARRLP